MNLQNQHETDNTAEQTSDKLTTAAASRRKFLVRASAASLPVIASVQSGSAWGCVELTCSKGTQTLSTGGSAVASAVANKSTAYTSANRPKWSSFTTIDSVISADYNSYLISSFFTGKTWYVGATTNQRTKITSTTDCKTWLTQVASGKVYGSQTSTTLVTRRDSYSSGLTLSAYGNNTRVIVPGFFDPNPIGNGSYSTSVMWILSGTSFTNIFKLVPEFTGTIGAYKSSKYPYVAAAFIGALWERHPEYRLRFANKPLCYPAPEEIVNRFNRSTKEQREGMENLFEYYTTGKVDGKTVA